MNPGEAVIDPRPDWLTWGLRLIVGGVFVAAAAGKIINPPLFVTAIENYRLMPHSLVHLLAITLPWIELVTGLAVITGVWLRAGALVIAAMAVVFFFAISSALARGLNIHCGCFGTVGGREVGFQNLALDSSMLALSIWLLWRTRPTRAASAPAVEERPAGDSTHASVPADAAGP